MSGRRRRGRRGGAGGPFSLFAFQDIMCAVTGVMIVTTLLLVMDLLTRTVTAAPTPTMSTTEATPFDPAELEALRAQRDRLRSAIEESSNNDDTLMVIAGSVLQQLTERLDRARDQRLDAEAQSAALAATAEALRTRGETLDERARQLAEQLAEVETRVAARLNTQRVTRLGGEASGKETWWVRLSDGPWRAGRLVSSDVATGTENAGAVDLGGTADDVLRWVETLDPAGDALVLLVEPSGVEAFHGLQGGLRAHGYDVGWDLVLPENPEADP